MSNDNDNKRPQWLGNVLLLFLSTAIALVLAEFVFRAVKQLQWQEAATQWDHQLYVMFPDNPVEYGLRPDSQRENKIPRTGATWHYRINADGFRGEDFPVTKSADRILFMGDSYMFGWAEDEERTFPVLVQRRLAEPPYELPVEAFNLGVPGYNTEQEAHLLAQVIDRYAPDLVVLGYVMNDAEPQKNVPQRPEILYRYVTSWLWAYIRQQVNHHVFAGEQVLPTGLNEHEPFLQAVRQQGGKWAEVRRAFAAMASLCRERGVPFLVLVFPGHAQPFAVASYPYSEIHEAVTRLATEHGVPVIDGYEYMRGKNKEHYQVRGDGHPNGRAFAVYANVLAPRVYELLGGR